MNSFLNLTEHEHRDRADRLCTDVTPALVITNWMDIPQIMLQAANNAGVPILKSPRTTNRVVVRITNYLGAKFAPTTAAHGVLIDIYGVGVLIMGQSGVGKSETALELVTRDQRLLAYDALEIWQVDYHTLIRCSPTLIEHVWLIRGLGILTIMTLFGAGAVLSSKRISYIVLL